MNFLERLFGGGDNKFKIKKSKNPDNTVLTFLLDIYGQHPSDESYKAVIEEITNGNPFLLLPSLNEKRGHEWLANGTGWDNSPPFVSFQSGWFKGFRCF